MPNKTRILKRFFVPFLTLQILDGLEDSSLYLLTQCNSTGEFFGEVLKSWYRLHHLTFGLCSDTTFPCLVVVFAWQRDDYQLAAENKHRRANVLGKGVTNRGPRRAEYLLLRFLPDTPDCCRFATQHLLSWCHICTLRHP